MRSALWTSDKKIILLGGWYAAPAAVATPSAAAAAAATSSTSSNNAQVLDDFCKLQARRGSIYVGFVGEEVPRPERNFFQRLGRRWRGEEED
jgi:hypothetical protein